MDRLKKEIKTVKNRLNQIEPMLLMLNENVENVDRNTEQIEHRLCVNEEDLGKRVAALEKYIKIIYEHVNGAIERVNTLHQYLKELTNETLPDSDDEFSFDEFNPDEK